MKKYKIINSLIIISLTLIFSVSYSFAQARIGISTFSEKRVERIVEPDYPEWAQEQGIEGEVEIKCWVLPSGEVRNVEILRPSGWPELDECASQALMRWKFSPIEGEEIQWGIVSFKFELELIGILGNSAIAKENDWKLPPELKEWVGKKIIFLPQQKSLQEDSYQLYSYEPLERYPYMPLSWPSYQELVARTAVIIEMERDKDPWEWDIVNGVLKIEDSNELLYTKVLLTLEDGLEDVGFISEMDEAKKYIGKTVWNKRIYGLGTYDPDKDEVGVILIKNLEKLTVIKIEWAWDEHTPLRFYFKTEDGKVGWWDGSYSERNYSSCLFSDVWCFEDPYKLYPDWSQRAWKAVEERKIYIGMTKEMVLMSRGKPKDINRTVTKWGVDEQWIYSSQYLYFENGELTAFQD